MMRVGHGDDRDDRFGASAAGGVDGEVGIPS